MAWRLAKSLEKMRAQVNTRFPNRSKKADGTIGDASHSARKSDHNPNSKGVVCAMDLTHDPKNGLDSYKAAEILRLNKDPRINYVISNGRIFSSSVQPWVWRKYTGSSKHDKHVHISVKQDPKFYDDTSVWKTSVQM